MSSEADLRVVSVSGGKDSTACAILALERHPADEVRLVFADTGNEHEETYAYVNEYLPSALGLPVHVVRADLSERVLHKRDVVNSKWGKDGVTAGDRERALAALVPTGNPFLDLCLWKGRFPSRMAQFCTQELKVAPLNAYLSSLAEPGCDVESWQGIRWDESAKRRNAKEREDLFDAGDGIVSAYRPILSWTAQQTVDFVRSRGVLLNPLYSQGMSRVGCMPCIHATKPEIYQISERFPHHIDRIEGWEDAVGQSSKRGAATFFARLSQHRNCSNEFAAEAFRIRNMVEWAKTTRGGVQYDLLSAATPPPACQSAYGLCE